MDFSQANLNTLQDAINRYVYSRATELPVDATAVIPELAQVAVSVGFSPSTGLFFERMKNRPISTLIAFVAFAGGSGVALTPSTPL